MTGFESKREATVDKLQEPVSEALKRIAAGLRLAGARLPAPEPTGTIEGSFVSGLCVALAIVESEIEAQPAQEPVAHVYSFDDDGRPRIAWDNAKGIKIGDKLYTAPPQREWVGLTNEEIYMNCPNWLSQEQCKVWIQQVEAKLKEKNT